MIRRIVVTALLLISTLVVDLAEADAARRRGFFLRARRTRTTSYHTNSPSWKNNSSQKLHETHSRSAILDGFFGPYPGSQGHDRSWYVGR
ncbi:MAG: hypothetical protein GXP24_10850 [Planctomycetes bacterium]|nr:hypothetical protein [Planctomycetota bacterium]